MSGKTIIKEPKTFTTIDGNTLMMQKYEPLRYCIEKILPHGLFIMAGSGKIGKSWLALDIGAAVATGGKLWEFNAGRGDVLYLALEDNHARLQARLKIMETENMDMSHLHIATSSLGITGGLLEQTENFLTKNPETRLIIIDTLERIRDGSFDKTMYSYDYRDMTTLRKITDKYKLTLLLVHHTRKASDADPLNTLSGSTGLVGAADGVFVLEKETRTGSTARLTIANRDTEGFSFDLEFDAARCRWQRIDDEDEPICAIIDDFLRAAEWSGTATELSELLNYINGDATVTPLTVTRHLKSNAEIIRTKYNITVTFDRKRDGRYITLMRGGYIQA
jgi:hypothetical protein